MYCIQSFRAATMSRPSIGGFFTRSFRLRPTPTTTVEHQSFGGKMEIKEKPKSEDIVDSNGFPVKYNSHEVVHITDTNGFSEGTVIIDKAGDKEYPFVITDSNGFPL